MGDSPAVDSLNSTSNMKMFVVLALAACAFAEPEADPAVLLAGNGVYAPSVYNAGLYSNVVRPYSNVVRPYTTVSAPLVSSYNYRYASPLVSALSPVHAIGKREAEAEPEADAQVYSTYATGVPVSTYGAHVAAPLTTYNVAAPLTTSYAANIAAAPMYYRSNFVHSPVSALTTYNTPYVHTLGKREAEAEADAQFFTSPVAYTTAAHVAAPLTYTTAAHVATPVSTYATAAHIAPVTTYAAQAAYVAPSHTLTSYNNPQHYTAVSNGVFGPKYIAKNGAVQHIVKREAEAKAQWLNPTLYNTAAVVPSVYNTAAVVPSVYNAAAVVPSSTIML